MLIYLKYICVFLLAFWSIQRGNCLVRFNDATFPELVTNGRSLGMGNAYNCRSDDASSAFYNPAGLGTVRWTHFHFNNLHVELNRGLILSTTGGQLSSVSTKLMKGFTLEQNRQILVEEPDRVIGYRVNAMPNFTTRYFTVGYLYSTQHMSYLGPAETDQFEYAKRTDMGPYAALNISLFGGVIKFGVTGVILTRQQIVGTSDRSTALSISTNDYQLGNTLNLTGGARLVLPIKFLPTFSGVIHNFMRRDWYGGGAAGRPPRIQDAVDVGFSITPQLSKLIRWHIEINYKDLTNKHPEVNRLRKIVAGMEFDFGRIIYLRFGYGDGFGSASIGIKAQALEFDATTYAVDLAESGFKGRGDRRFSLTLSTGF